MRCITGASPLARLAVGCERASLSETANLSSARRTSPCGRAGAVREILRREFETPPAPFELSGDKVPTRLHGMHEGDAVTPAEPAPEAAPPPQSEPPAPTPTPDSGGDEWEIGTDWEIKTPPRDGETRDTGSA